MYQKSAVVSKRGKASFANRFFRIAAATAATAGLLLFAACSDNGTDDGGGTPVTPGTSGTSGGNWYQKDTSAATFTISTAADLAELAELVNGGKTFAGKTITLAKDISLSAYASSNKDFNSGKGWIPIGRDNRPFSGTIEGNGKTVSGLYINDNASDYMGLFGFVKNAVIRDLGVVDVSIYGKGNVGGLSGRASGGVVENCYSTGTLRGTGSGLGGVIGYVDESCKITGCYSTATFSGVSAVGGVVGNLYLGGLTECYYVGDISGTTEVGGVVGSIGYRGSGVNNVSACYSGGTVNGADKVGGVAGYNGGFLTHCYSTSAVKGSSSVGGVVGFISASTKISNCYSIGTVSGDSQIGGVVGGNGGGQEVIQCAGLGSNINATTTTDIGRIRGAGGGSQTGNVAFIDMTLNGNATEWKRKGVAGADGADITIADIIADGTIGSRFLAIDGWTVQNGKLPGLFGKPVDLPDHLKP